MKTFVLLAGATPNMELAQAIIRALESKPTYNVIVMEPEQAPPMLTAKDLAGLLRDLRPVPPSDFSRLNSLIEKQNKKQRASRDRSRLRHALK